MAMELSHRVVYTGEDAALDYSCLLIPKLLYRWGDLRTLPAVRSDPVPGVVVSEQHASHYVCIALALVMGRDRYRLNEKQTSDAYVSRAIDLLGNPLERVQWSPDDVSTLNLMAFYYIERNQLKDAYTCAGMALR
jgi:hypothetical protein